MAWNEREGMHYYLYVGYDKLKDAIKMNTKIFKGLSL